MQNNCPHCGNPYTSWHGLAPNCTKCGKPLFVLPEGFRPSGNPQPTTNSDSSGCAVIIFVLLLLFGGGYGARHLILRNADEAEARQNERFAQMDAELKKYDSPPATTPVQSAHNTIVVKGLYIGMDFNSLPDAVAQKFGSGQWQIEKDNYPYCYVRSLDLEKMRNSYLPTGFMPDDLKAPASIKVDVTFDPAGKLGYIKIPHRVADFLFGGSSMTTREFYQNFASSYPIPQMEYDVANDGTGFWKCTTPDNVTIKITTDKDVYIFKDRNQQGVQKKFN